MQQPCPEYSDPCTAVIHQNVDVALPICLVPLADVGGIKITCCGEPRVECCKEDNCSGGLSLRVTQTVTYKIPIEYHVNTSTGEVTSECKRVFNSTNCNSHHY